MRPPPSLLAGVVLAVLLAACSGGSSTTTQPVFTLPPIPTTLAPSTTETPTSGWAVDTSGCPAEATTPITGTVRIGSVMALSGGIPAAAVGPAAVGLRAAIEQAERDGELPGLHLVIDIADDGYDPDRTPDAVAGLLASGVDLVVGITGTAHNLAARPVLEQACVPQLMALTGAADWADAAHHPWTTGGAVPLATEVAIYGTVMAQRLQRASTIGVYAADSDFGRAYVAAARDVAESIGFTVATEQVAPSDLSRPTAQAQALAAARPDVVVAAPVGVDCPSFLRELAQARQAAVGWRPLVFLTNTCASPAVMVLAGAAAGGVLTSSAVKDVLAPSNADDPAVKAFLAATDAAANPATAGAVADGWTVGELTVAVLRQAANAPGGLTRASIIDAARNFHATPSLARPGVVASLDGLADQTLLQALQVIQWDAAAGAYTDVGDVVQT